MKLLKEKKAISLLLILIIAIVAIVIVVVSAIIFLGNWLPPNEIVGSGNLATQTKDFSDFSSLAISSGFEAEISKSSSYSISITADDNVIDYVRVSKTGTTLNIGLQTSILYQSITIQAEIGIPELNSLDLSGGTQGTINEFDSVNMLSLDLSGGSQLEGAFITTQDVNIELSGGSQLNNFTGEAHNSLIELSEGSQLDIPEFTVNDLNANLSGGSQATISLNGRLDATLSGGSTLNYYGNPTLGDIEVSGGSTINPK